MAHSDRRRGRVQYLLGFAALLFAACGAARASTLNLTAGVLTLTIAANESGTISSTSGGNNLTMSSTNFMMRTGDVGGFNPALNIVSDDFVANGITAINILSAGGSIQINLQYTGNPLPQFSIGAGFNGIIARNDFRTAGRPMSFASQVILNDNVVFDSTGAGANPAGADVTFFSSFEPFTGAPRSGTVICGTAGVATFVTGAGRPVAPLTAFTVSGRELRLMGNIQVDGGGDVDFTGVTFDTFLDVSGTITIDTDIAGGATNAGDVLFSSGPLNPFNGGGTTNVVIDASVDGGGAPGDVSMPGGLGLNINCNAISVLADDLVLNGANSQIGQTYQVNSLNLTGALSPVSGGGQNLVIVPLDLTLNIQIGSNVAGRLSLDTTEVGFLHSTITPWGTITIGSATYAGTIFGTASTTSGFQEPVRFVAQGAGGAINFNGATINGTGAASITQLTNNGDIITGALSTVNQPINVTSASGLITSIGVISTTGGAGGTITIQGTNGPVLLNSSVTTQGATITLNGRGTTPAGREVGVFLNTVGGSVNAGGGAISMTGNGGTVGAGSDFGVLIGNTSIQTTGAGTITLTGTGGTSGTAVFFNGGTTSTVNGNLTVMGTGTQRGIYMAGGTVSSGAGILSLNGTSTTGLGAGILLQAGTFGTTTGNIVLVGSSIGATSFDGVDIETPVTSTSGNISITGTSGANIGANITNNVTTGGSGIVTISGTGSTFGFNVQGSAAIQVSNGAINVTGISNGVGGGIRMANTSTVTATGTGTVNMLGTNVSAAAPAFAYLGGSIGSNGGDVRVSGVASGAAIGFAGNQTFTGSGNLYITGTSVGTNGVSIASAISGATNVAISGNNITVGASITVTAGNTLTLNVIGSSFAQTAGTITTPELRLAGAGPFTFLTTNQVGVLAGSVSSGVTYSQAAALTISSVTSIVANALPAALPAATTTDGLTASFDIDLRVTGANNGLLVANDISYTGATPGSLLLAAAGNLVLTSGVNVRVRALGGAPLAMRLAGDLDASSSGAIVLNFANLDSGGGDVILSGGSDVTAAGLANGRAMGTPAARQGVFLDSSTITSGAGNITIRGQSAVAAINSQGILFDASLGCALTTTSGNITLDGIGSPNAPSGGNGAAGVRQEGNDPSLAISTLTGTITITGVGGSGANSDGIAIAGSSPIRTQGGTIVLNGTGTSAVVGSSGIELSNGALAEATGIGGVNIVGVAADAVNPGIEMNAANVRTTTATLNVTARNSAQGGIVLGNNSVLGAATQSGNILMVIGDLSLDATSRVQSTGRLFLNPTNPGDNMNLGTGGSGGFDLTPTDLAGLADGFTDINIGRNNSAGAVTINGATFTDPVTIQSPDSPGAITINGATGTGNASFIIFSDDNTLAGDITTAGGDVVFGGAVTPSGNRSINAGAGTVSFNPLNLGLNVLTVTGAFRFAQAGMLTATVNGASPGQFGQIVVNGSVTLNDVPLVATIGYSPAGGDAIVLINNANGAINGTFQTLAEGAAVSGGPLLISYAAGVGLNDVVLRAPILNQAPTDIALTPSAIEENQPAGTTVGALTASDPDLPLGPFTFTLVTGTGSTDNAAFTISGTQLLAAAVFDFETKSSYSIRVRATDPGGLSFEKALTVTVTNRNEAPTIGSILVNPTNPIAGQPVTFTTAIVDPDSPTVSINYTYGDGSGDPSGQHTFETPGTYTVTVTINDGTSTVTSTVTVTVTASGAAQFRVGVKFNLGAAGAGKDRIQVGGIVFVPRGLAIASQVLTLNIGGNIETFLLSAKGAAKTANASFALRLGGNRTRAGGETKFRATIKNANYLAKLKLNPPLAANGLPQAIPVSLTLGGTTVTSTVPLKFRGREGRFNGSGKSFSPLRF